METYNVPLQTLANPQITPVHSAGVVCAENQETIEAYRQTARSLGVRCGHVILMKLTLWKPRLAFLWRWFSNICTMGVLSILIGWCTIQAFSSRGDVVIVTSPAAPITRKVHPGGTLEFVVSLARVEACPGEVVQTYITKGGGAGGSVTTRRRVIDSSVRAFENWHYREQVPANVEPGPARYVMTVDSRCPDHTEVDTIADFEVEVEK